MYQMITVIIVSLQCESNILAMFLFMIWWIILGDDVGVSNSLVQEKTTQSPLY